ncbi:MAG: DUF4364 family protein [Oscillospiraceae bacterium]|nr:DUF4364 family protein [Oscillospiraceae bacterium]
MANDAFTAGVVPGGLNSHSDVKILLCYLLRVLDCAVGHDELVNALTERGLVNYFEITGSLAELQDAKHILQTDEGYSVTDTGRQIAEMLGDDLPLTVRERAVEEVRYALNYANKKRENQVEIRETANGFEVECTVSDEAAGPLFSLTLYVPGRKAANTVRKNFIEKAEELLRANISLLTGESLQ